MGMTQLCLPIITSVARGCLLQKSAGGGIRLTQHCRSVRDWLRSFHWNHHLHSVQCVALPHRSMSLPDIERARRVESIYSGRTRLVSRNRLRVASLAHRRLLGVRVLLLEPEWIADE